MKTRYFLWLLPLLFFYSCTAPRVVTKISPEAPEGKFAMGREYIPLESNQIGVELGFDGIQGSNMVFDLVVHNGTRDTLTLCPADFFYVVLDSAHTESALDSSWFSVHPDTVLMYYDQTLEQGVKAKGRNTILGILQASYDILYNTSGFIATDDPAFILDAVFRTAGTADQYIAQGKMISSDMDLISQEKELVDEEIFRTCRLPPEQLRSGYVYFPLHDRTAYYMFCFPVEQHLFQFVYRQQKELVY